MPSKTLRQHNLMALVANDPKAAKRVGIPQSVGAEYMKADKGRKFAKSDSRPDLQGVNRPKTNQGSKELFAGGGMAKKLPPFMGKETPAEERKEMAVKRVSPKLYREGEKREGVHGKSGMEKPSKYARGGGVESKGKTKGTMVKMRMGGRCG